MKKAILLFLTSLILFSFSACKNKEVKSENTASNNVTTTNQQTAKTLIGEIPLDKLSNNIKEYINKNYAGYKLTKAAYDPLCTGENAIDVGISKDGSKNFSLIFLLEGTFVQKEEDINLNSAPAKILSTVKEKFSGYKPADKIEKLTIADGTIQYLLDLSKDTLTKEVIFKPDGTVVCER
ncbi:MAG: hypothetical protein LDL01_01085 [Ignavibacterium sp.]|nr:hypothetical protein [Ignavibacterium sp.]